MMNSKRLIIYIIVAVAVIIGIIIMFLTLQSDNSAEHSPPPTEVTEEAVDEAIEEIPAEVAVEREAVEGAEVVELVPEERPREEIVAPRPDPETESAGDDRTLAEAEQLDRQRAEEQRRQETAQKSEYEAEVRARAEADRQMEKQREELAKKSAEKQVKKAKPKLIPKPTPAPSPPPPPPPPPPADVAPSAPVTVVEASGSMLAARGARAGNMAADTEEIGMQENNFIETGDWANPAVYPSKSIRSWETLNNSLDAGVTPEPNEIQINELVNAYSYSFPESKNSVSLIGYLGDCPWQKDNLLIMLGAKLSLQSNTYIEDPHWLVAFNVQQVRSYRLLGQENFFEAIETEALGKLHPGESVITLYEVIPVAEDRGKPLLAAKFSYLANDEMHEPQIIPGKTNLNEDDMYFAAAVAELGLILRNSQYKGDASMTHLEKVLSNIKNRPADVAEIQYFIDRVMKINSEQ